ncbi:SET domain-containing protein-lysine N-methyltransferase [Trichocoleus desertorum]|uniref:SET domain-containing protein-lysine N-methyltransferase n=1 Tax=Trichocoleus desertorum GB2-A4 TaxID=2933944 RepID=A0ABV0JI53_9CYAN|nr:SET domain-containing protein-lysine N-methyltransferase [Trichocoleus sp. FACHB-46]
MYLSSLNHSCDPNVVIDVNRLELRAIRGIEAGDELTFFYPSTEWEMSTPFPTQCQSSQCLKMIAGAKYLSIDLMSRYTLSSHISTSLLRALSELSLTNFEQVVSSSTHTLNV